MLRRMPKFQVCVTAWIRMLPLKERENTPGRPGCFVLFHCGWRQGKCEKSKCFRCSVSVSLGREG